MTVNNTPLQVKGILDAAKYAFHNNTHHDITVYKSLDSAIELIVQMKRAIIYLRNIK